MIKDALQYIVGLNKPVLVEVEGRQYTTQKLSPVKETLQDTLNVSTLSSIVEYIQKNFDDIQSEFVIQIESPTCVSLKAPIFGEFNQRTTMVEATPFLPRTFDFGRYMDAEEFIIGLQSKFVKNDGTIALMAYVGNIQEENVRQVGDDGVSQSAVVKNGIASVEHKVAPNPVALAPYRTFPEVEQPKSNFVFRLRKGPEAALFEADGGAWKLQAVENIKAYFDKELAAEITDQKVIVLA